MNSGFWTAVTGAKSHQSAIDTSGNNIANINTIGYRGSTIEFATLFERYHAINARTTSSDQGLGARVGATAIDTRSGSYQATDNTFDMAINGDGWFGVIAPNTFDAKQIAYTRAGAFSRDRDGALVTQQGNYVLGTSYGNMINENGAWRVLPNVPTDALGSVGAQTKLLIPGDLYYPPIATAKATLNANLVNMPSAPTATAWLNTPLTSLNSPYGISVGETALIVSGESQPITQDGNRLTIALPIAPIGETTRSFTINGNAITATWNALASANEIATAMAEAINASGAAIATAQNDILTIGADNAIAISGGDFAPVNATVFTVNEATTLNDLQSAIAQNIKAIYGDDAWLTYKSDGTLTVSSQSGAAIEISSANKELSAAFGSFDGALKQLYITQPFLQAYTAASQRAIAPNGEILLLEGNLRSVNGNFVGEVKLKRATEANAESSLAGILKEGVELGLQGGENLYFSFGKAPSAIGGSQGYLLDLRSDTTNGTPPYVRFTIDGEQFEWTGNDGMNAYEAAVAIKAQLNAIGYDANVSANELLIFPKTDSLIITGGETNLPQTRIDPSAFGKIAYQNGESVGSFIDRANTLARAIGGHIAMDQSRLAVVNDSASPLNVNVYRADNTPESLYRLFAPLVSALGANAEKTTEPLTAREIISSSSGIPIASGTSVDVTLQNGDEPLVFTFNTTASQVASQRADITADGVQKGNLQGYGVGDHGEIIASFDNGRQTQIAQVAVYQFVNDQGLMRIGDTMFMESENSGAPFFWVDELGNQQSAIVGRTLENSNVQSARALTDLIIFQRSYEGSAKAITTNDQMIQNAINLKR
ncbi:MAG: flagellar hook-basal body complex protein [Helicobacteraceae bacterium]|jgi:flagellar hook-basal body protein|nr:flagellar hook-basal body complex protein [Helicobacteraceae bacterium]